MDVCKATLLLINNMKRKMKHDEVMNKIELNKLFCLPERQIPTSTKENKNTEPGK